METTNKYKNMGLEAKIKEIKEKSLKLTDLYELYDNKKKYLDKKVRVKGWIDKVNEQKENVIVDLRFDLENKRDCEKCEKCLHGDSLILPLVFDRKQLRGRGIRNPDFDLQVYDLWLESYIVVSGKLTSENGTIQLRVSEMDELSNYKGGVMGGLIIIGRRTAEVLSN